MAMHRAERRADRLSPHVDENTVGTLDSPDFSVDDFVRTRLWTYQILDRIQKVAPTAVPLLDDFAPVSPLFIAATSDRACEVYPELVPWNRLPPIGEQSLRIQERFSSERPPSRSDHRLDVLRVGSRIKPEAEVVPGVVPDQFIESQRSRADVCNLFRLEELEYEPIRDVSVELVATAPAVRVRCETPEEPALQELFPRTETALRDLRDSRWCTRRGCSERS